MKTFSQFKFLFPDYSSLCQVYKQQNKQAHKQTEMKPGQQSINI